MKIEIWSDYITICNWCEVFDAIGFNTRADNKPQEEEEERRESSHSECVHCYRATRELSSYAPSSCSDLALRASLCVWVPKKNQTLRKLLSLFFELFAFTLSFKNIDHCSQGVVLVKKYLNFIHSQKPKAKPFYLFFVSFKFFNPFNTFYTIRVFVSITFCVCLDQTSFQRLEQLFRLSSDIELFRYLFFPSLTSPTIHSIV